MVAAFRSALARPDRRAEIMRRLTAAKVAPEDWGRRRDRGRLRGGRHGQGRGQPAPPATSRPRARKPFSLFRRNQAKAERSRLPASAGGSAPRRFGSNRGAHFEPARFTGDPPAWRHADATRCSRSTSIGRASPSRIRIADASTHRPPLVTAETTARRPMARTVPGSPGRPIAPRRTTRAAPYTNGEASAAGRFTGAASRSRRRFARSAAAAPFARQAEHRASDSPSSAPPQSTHWRPRAFSRHRRIAAIR